MLLRLNWLSVRWMPALCAQRGVVVCSLSNNAWLGGYGNASAWGRVIALVHGFFRVRGSASTARTPPEWGGAWWRQSQHHASRNAGYRPWRLYV